MQVPAWLANISGANGYSSDRLVNAIGGVAPGWGDVAKGIGHDMMEHYRRQAAPPGQGGALAPPMTAAQPQAPVPLQVPRQVPQPTPLWSQQGLQLPPGLDIAKILGGR